MLSTVMTKGERGMILEDWRHMNMSYLKAMCMYNVMYIPEGCNHVKLSSRKYTLHVLHIIKCTSGGFSDCARQCNNFKENYLLTGSEIGLPVCWLLWGGLTLARGGTPRYWGRSIGAWG